MTGEAPPMPGALPPTPGASEGEYDSEPDYVFVERVRISADSVVGKDGDMPPPPPAKNTAHHEGEEDSSESE